MEISTLSGYILFAIFSLIASLRALRQSLKAGCTLLLLAFAAYAAAAMTLLFLPIYVSIDADILPDMAVYLFQPGAWLHDVWTQMGGRRGSAIPCFAHCIFHSAWHRYFSSCRTLLSILAAACYHLHNSGVDRASAAWRRSFSRGNLSPRLPGRCSHCSRWLSGWSCSRPDCVASAVLSPGGHDGNPAWHLR